MAFTDHDKPGEWFGAGYAAAANAISLNTNDAASNKTLPELTDEEANAITGDARKVIYALAEAFYAKYNSLVAADRPAQMQIYRSTSSNDITGETTRTYTLVFKVTPTGMDVAAEPS